MPSLKTAFIFINHKSHKRILSNKTGFCRSGGISTRIDKSMLRFLRNDKLDFSFKSFFLIF